VAQRIPIQTYLPRDIVAQLREACAAAHISMSEWIRSAVIDACRQSETDDRSDPMTERLTRDLTFATVALDALLAGHPDPDLRPRTHEAYARKLANRGARPAPIEGGDDEA